jgi:hypothetical protein
MDVNEILAFAATDTAAPVAPAEAPTETPAVVEAPAVETVDTPAEVEAKTEVPEETPELKAATEKLRQAALRKQAEREARQRMESVTTAVTQENATLKAENASYKQRLEALEAFERNPLEYLEKHNEDPVAFLQNAHRVALNAPAMRAERMAQEALRRTEELQKRPEPQEVVDTRLQAAAYRDATANLVAESESGAYPLFAAKDAEERIDIATRVAKALVKSGNKNFGYAELCSHIEESLVSEVDHANKVLAAAKPRQQKTPPAPKNGTPKTVTQDVAASDSISVGKMTQEERDAAADRLINEAFFSH